MEDETGNAGLKRDAADATPAPTESSNTHQTDASPEESIESDANGVCNPEPAEPTADTLRDDIKNGFKIEILNEYSPNKETFYHHVPHERTNCKLNYADWKKPDKKSENGSGDYRNTKSTSVRSFYRKRFPERRNTSLSALWRYPTVHQSFNAYPILAKHSTTLARARNQSEKLRQELEKDPQRHRASDENGQKYSLQAPNMIKGPKKSQDGSRGHTTALAGTGETRRKTASKLQTLDTKMDTEHHEHRASGFSGTSSRGGDNNYRSSRKYSKASTILYPTASGIATPLNPVLSSIRTHNTDVENNKFSTKCKNCCRSWGRCCANCMTSYRCTCVTFFGTLTIIVGLALTAIIYPVYKALTYIHED
ncbi:unnamed protein product [Orchesella dallaii]|uniref:Uncharacterized protein n=1 Tax=Orchesella dallaii TaxID=48710 RepID=A0ABP1RA66_9HEXA